MNTPTYRGYSARIEYSAEDDCFVGHVTGIHDIVGFHAASFDEAVVAFQEAVNDYLWACEELGSQPNRPSAGPEQKAS